MPYTKRRRLVTSAVAVALGATTLAACGSSDDGGDARSGPVSLTYWTWTPGMDKVVDLWNRGPGKEQRITVTVKKQASGDTLVTKILTAHKAGQGPDLVQAEYQALPTLVSNDALADISGEVGDVKGKFAEGVWQQTTLGTDAVYAVPQDIGPMMFYYREDLFKKYDLKVPATWDEFAETARELKKAAPDKDLTTFSANDSGLFAGLAQQAGAQWWTTEGDKWKVGIDDAGDEEGRRLLGRPRRGGRRRQPADVHPGLEQGAQHRQADRLGQRRVGARHADHGRARHQGQVGHGPAPPVVRQREPHRQLGRLLHRRHHRLRAQGRRRRVRRVAEHRRRRAQRPGQPEGGIYPASTSAQLSGAFSNPPAFFANQPDFYTKAAAIAKTTAPSAWGPNVNVAYTAFKDAFGAAAKNKSDFTAALGTMQEETVADLKKQGFEVAR